MVTIDDLMNAPMFTVWRGLEGACAVRQDLPPDIWDLFAQCCVDLSEASLDELEVLGLELVDGGGGFLAPNRDDELAMEHGLLDRFDDVDAALCALNEGFSLVKVPDHLGCKYFRLYVLAPLPDNPRSRHDSIPQRVAQV